LPGDLTIPCTRCGKDGLALTKAPFRIPLGDRILQEICAECWGEWLQHQTLLINHHGLDPRDASSKEFLYGQIESVLLGGGGDAAAEIDRSKQGTVEWSGGTAPES